MKIEFEFVEVIQILENHLREKGITVNDSSSELRVTGSSKTGDEPTVINSVAITLDVEDDAIWGEEEESSDD